MAEPIDYIVDDNGGYKIENGDFVKGNATQQHQKLLLLAEKGEIKQFPVAGVGIRGYILDEKSTSELKSEIGKEFEADGMVIDELSISNGIIKVEAYYGD